jgi:hypothetical protein
MQIDDRSFADWLRTNDWTSPIINIRKGAQVLKQKRSYLKTRFPNLPDDQLWAASIAAYNTGEGNVAKSLAAGKPVDSTTAGGDYSSAVLAMAAKFTSAAGVA